MLIHLTDLARAQGCDWLGLETGTMEAFAPARDLYESFGFAACEPFDDYTVNEFSVCMSLRR
jgi:putative acetyltransferase